MDLKREKQECSEGGGLEFSWGMKSSFWSTKFWTLVKFVNFGQKPHGSGYGSATLVNERYWVWLVTFETKNMASGYPTLHKVVFLINKILNSCQVCKFRSKTTWFWIWISNTSKWKVLSLTCHIETKNMASGYPTLLNFWTKFPWGHGLLHFTVLGAVVLKINSLPWPWWNFYTAMQYKFTSRGICEMGRAFTSIQ